MRRADRLFQIVQLLRGRGTMTAASLGAELGVSERTIYRDMRDLTLSGVPIEGEAGIGYALPPNFDLPPLMFTEDELQALALGASMVEAFADEALAAEARRALSKVHAVLPTRLKHAIDQPELLAPPFHRKDLAAHLEPLRKAAAARNKVQLTYLDQHDDESERTVRPLGLYFWGKAWTLTAWCELREDFRTFRPDRIQAICVLADTFEDEPDKSLEAFLARMAERRRRHREEDERAARP